MALAPYAGCPHRISLKVNGSEEGCAFRCDHWRFRLGHLDPGHDLSYSLFRELSTSLLLFCPCPAKNKAHNRLKPSLCVCAARDSCTPARRAVSSLLRPAMDDAEGQGGRDAPTQASPSGGSSSHLHPATAALEHGERAADTLAAPDRDAAEMCSHPSSATAGFDQSHTQAGTWAAAGAGGRSTDAPVELASARLQPPNPTKGGLAPGDPLLRRAQDALGTQLGAAKLRLEAELREKRKALIVRACAWPAQERCQSAHMATRNKAYH